MTPQQIVFYIGIAAFAIAAGLAIWSVFTFFSLDIPDVMADLSGRRRALGVGSTGRHGYLLAGSARSRRASDGAQDESSASAWDAQFEDAEGNIETVVDTKLVPVSSRKEVVSSDTPKVVDDNRGAEVEPRSYHRNDAERDYLDDETEMEVEVYTDLPTEVESSPFGDSFRITRSIVFVHSDEVISAG